MASAAATHGAPVGTRPPAARQPAAGTGVCAAAVESEAEGMTKGETEQEQIMELDDPLDSWNESVQRSESTRFFEGGLCLSSAEEEAIETPGDDALAPQEGA